MQASGASVGDRGAPTATARRRGGSLEARPPAHWDAAQFVSDYERARKSGDDREMRQLLREVSKHNYQLVQGPLSREVPRTDRVTSAEAKQRVPGSGREPQYTISDMTTGDALLHFATHRPTSVVCALNFANGETVGGGYLSGARAQEEELCRQFPTLYTSLSRAKEYGRAYPFGPPGGNERFADVLFTPVLRARRHSRATGYRLLREDESVDNICMVSAAAPNLASGRESWEPHLVAEAIRSILVVPKLKHKNAAPLDTLVLGAWGCGAFGCDPREMATLFAKVLLEEKVGRLYKEIHFAIPVGPDGNSRVWETTLKEKGMNLQRTEGGDVAVMAQTCPLTRSTSTPTSSSGAAQARRGFAGGAATLPGASRGGGPSRPDAGHLPAAGKPSDPSRISWK